MASDKLSVFLRRNPFYRDLKDQDPDQILSITDDYIKQYRDRVYQQPEQARRSFTVEMVDISEQLDVYEQEIYRLLDSMQSMRDQYGTHFGEGPLAELEILEDQRNIWADWATNIQSALGSMTRFVMEHYSEEDLGVPFLEKFTEFLGPFDWLTRRAKYFLDQMKTSTGKLKPLDRPYSIKRDIESFALSELLGLLYDYHYEEESVTTDLLDYLVGNGYDTTNLSEDAKLDTGGAITWLYYQYKRKLILDAMPFADYQSKLDFVIKHHEFFEVEKSTYVFGEVRFTLRPTNDYEAEIFGPALWQHFEKYYYNLRLNGTDTKHDIPIRTYPELINDINNRLIKSPNPDRLIQNELRKVKDLFSEKKNSHIKGVFDYHYNLLVDAKLLVYDHDLYADNGPKYSVGALVKPYAQLLIFLETLDLHEHLEQLKWVDSTTFCFDWPPLSSIPQTEADKVRSRGFHLSYQTMGKTLKKLDRDARQTMEGLLSQPVPREDFEIIYQTISNVHLMRISGNAFRSSGKGLDHVALVDHFFEVGRSLADYDLSIRFLSALLDLWCFNNRSDQWAVPRGSFRKEFEQRLQLYQEEHQVRLTVDNGDISTVATMDKIKTSLSVQQLAILLRVLKESKIIAGGTSANKLTQLASSIFSSIDKDDISAKSLSNKYYDLDPTTLRNIASFIRKMDQEIEKLIKDSQS